MRLRARVILMLVAVVVPLVTGFTLYRFEVERRDAIERRVERLAGRIQERPGLACRARMSPRLMRRVKSPVFAYDHDLRPLSPVSPPLPPALGRALEASGRAEIVHERVWFDRRHLGATAVPIEGEPRCAAVVILWPRRDEGRPGVLRLVLQQGLLMLFALIATGLLISIPLVRRVRRLTEAVREAPAHGWELPATLLAGKDELSELAGAFQDTGARVAATIEELERRDEALKEYISNTTHDLAIPLTVLQHRLRKIQDRLEAEEEVEPELVRVALEESHYIAALIANMSAAARLEAGRTQQLEHEVDLAEVVERVVARHEPIARPREVSIDWAAPPEGLVVQGDSTLLEQAISNLVQNAVQYNARGGHVAVILEEEGEGDFSLRVMDDGPGAPEELLGVLAERAVRADDARNRNPGGQGFGLSIAQRVCAVHGLEMSLSNGDDAGLVVTIHGARRREA